MSTNLMKKVASLSLAMMMASTAVMAEGDDMSVKMSGKLREYFGQYNSGVKNTSAHFQQFGEANLAAKVKSGNISGYFELESRGLGMVTAIQRRLDAQFDALKISFGTIKPKESYAFSDDAESGTYTSDSSSFGFYKGELIKTEADGFHLEYKISGVKLGVSLYEADALNGTSYHLTDGKVAVSSTTSATIGTSSATIKEYKSGSATQVGVQGHFGDLELRLSSISSKTDDHTSSATVLNHAGSQAGLRYTIAEGFTASVDAGSKTIDQGSSKNKVYADSSLQVRYTLENQQDILVTLASATYKDEKTTDLSKDYSNAYTNLVYTIPMGQKVDMKFLYGSDAKTGAKAGSTAVTKSFAGAGLLAKF